MSYTDWREISELRKALGDLSAANKTLTNRLKRKGALVQKLQAKLAALREKAS